MPNVRTATTCAFVGVASMVLSQTSAAQSSPGILEEIVVTAQKRTERLLDVPISITALNDGAIARSRAFEVTDIAAEVPNLSFGLGDNKDTTISIRGIGDYTRNLGYDARTSVYVDGVFQGQSQAMNQSLMDVERIEVLRGPQGTLFGKNTISGAISIVTNKPSMDRSLEVGVNVGDYGTFEVEGIVNQPLLEDRLLLRVSGRHQTRDGHIENFAGGADLNDQDQQSGRLQLTYLATENLEFHFSADALEQDQRYTNAEAIAGEGAAQAPGIFTVNHDSIGRVDREIFGTSLTVDYTLPNGGTLTSISAYRESDAGNFQEEDYTSFAVMDSNFRDEDDQFSQELRYSSAGGGPIDYVAGLYYIRQDLETSHGADGGADFAIPGYSVLTFGELEAESYAAYFNGNLHFGGSWKATLGLRYTDEEKDLNYNISGGPPLFIDLTDYEDSYSHDAFTPRFGLTRHFGDDHMVYATYSRGFKSGGWNADFITTTEQLQFDAETADSYEAGYKGSFLEDRVKIGLSLFNTQFDDYQVSQFVPTSVGTIITLTNAGEVTTEGAELEMAASLPLGFSLRANVGYVDATFDSFEDAGGPGIDYDGNQLPFAPRVTGAMAVDFTYPLFDFADIDMRASYAYSDENYSNPNNQRAYRSPSYHVVDFRGGLRSTARGWSAYVYVDNLTDETYAHYTDVSFLGVNRAEYGRPRTWGVQVRAEF